MEAYYSSDEEIAWGPVTLREIKGDLKRPRSKPSRRHTISRSFKSMDSCSLSNVPETLFKDNKSDISDTSTAYYSPNESTKTSNCNFLDIPSNIINNPYSEASEYASVEDSHDERLGTKKEIHDIPKIVINDATNLNIDDSCINFVKSQENRNTYYDIAAFKQTLVENTLEDLEEEQSYEEDDEKFERDGNLSAEVIVISDDDDDENDNSRYSEISGVQEIFTYNETISSLKKEKSFDGYRSQYSVNNGIASETASNSFDNSCNISNEELVEGTGDNLGNVETCNKTDDSGTRNSSYVLPDIQHDLSTRKESLSSSPIIMPEIDFKQFEDSLTDKSLHLDDTIEEMNRFLREGLNYSMPNDEIIETTPVKQDAKKEKHIFTPNIKSGSSSSKKPSGIPRRNFETTLAAKREENKNSSPKYFKIPHTPGKVKFTQPTLPSHLKNIVSPVGLYIKNSPRVPLIQNVPQRKLTKITTTSVKQQNKENFPEFPEVVYKPSKKQIASTEKHIVVLPEYLKKLNVMEGRITKHEGRINQGADTSKLSRKLLDNNLTSASIDQSLLDNTGDISVVTNKQAFIK